VSHHSFLEDFGKRKVCVKFAPYSLMDEQREGRITTAEDFIACHPYYSPNFMSVNIFVFHKVRMAKIQLDHLHEK
jgi:hypothetical protein